MMSTLQGCNVSRADIAAVLAGRERLDFQDFLQFLASNTGSIQVGGLMGGAALWCGERQAGGNGASDSSCSPHLNPRLMRCLPCSACVQEVVRRRLPSFQRGGSAGSADNGLDGELEEGSGCD
jgi:hypothetical protein